MAQELRDPQGAGHELQDTSSRGSPVRCIADGERSGPAGQEQKCCHGHIHPGPQNSDEQKALIGGRPMALVNHAKREINAKLVYYGPGLSGKATNLTYIYRKLKPEC